MYSPVIIASTGKLVNGLEELNLCYLVINVRVTSAEFSGNINERTR